MCVELLVIKNMLGLPILPWKGICYIQPKPKKKNCKTIYDVILYLLKIKTIHIIVHIQTYAHKLHPTLKIYKNHLMLEIFPPESRA